MSNSHNAFDKISSTGNVYAIFKALGDCVCVKDKNDLFDSEPDPTHKDCFGTGLARKMVLSPVIRESLYTTTKGSNLETQTFERIKNNLLTLYFPGYFEIEYTDIIASLETDEHNELIKPVKVKYVYNVSAIDEYIENDFKFKAVKISKLQHAPFRAIIE